ncbi:MAG: glycosyltransferase family 2 protein [Anaerolineaceae bacterium]|nr:glycosyltransferase family 2 protein [Anaerolineaceae bacterium]
MKIACSEKDKVDLSICIPTLDASSYLKACLNSIKTFTLGLSYEVIVVDNASKDGTLAMLEQDFPEVTVIRNETNAGFAKPMNQALRLAKGSYLLALNPDTLLKEDVFGPQVDYLRRNLAVGVSIPKVLNEDGSFQKQSRRGEATPIEAFGYHFGLGKLFPRCKALNGYLQAWLPEDEIVEVKAVSGSCMLISRACYEAVGGFDEKIFAYQEDSDFCFRAREKGFKVMYVPITQIVHYGGKGGSKAQPFKSIWNWHYSYFYYYNKHLAKRYFFLVNWLFYLVMFGKFAVAVFKNIFSKRESS